MESFNKWLAMYALTAKESKKTFHNWMQSLLPAVVTSLLYFLVFGKIVGHRIGPMVGMNYTAFITPGLVMLNVVNSSYSASSFSLFFAKYMHHIEEVLVSPMSMHHILLSYIMAAILRGVVCGFLVLLVAFTLTPLHIVHPFLMLFVAFLAAGFFAMIGLINGLFANSFDAVGFVPAFVLTPLIFLSGVFYSHSMLPPSWHIITDINPLYYLVDAFRQAAFHKINMSIIYDIFIYLVMIAVAYAVSYYCAQRGHTLRN